MQGYKLREQEEGAAQKYKINAGSLTDWQARDKEQKATDVASSTMAACL